MSAINKGVILAAVLNYDIQEDSPLSEQAKNQAKRSFKKRQKAIVELAAPVIDLLSQKTVLCVTIKTGGVCFTPFCPNAHNWLFCTAINKAYKSASSSLMPKAIPFSSPQKVPSITISHHSEPLPVIQMPLPVHHSLNSYEQAVKNAHLPLYSEVTKGLNLHPDFTSLTVSPDLLKPSASPKVSIDDAALDLLMDNMDETTPV